MQGLEVDLHERVDVSHEVRRVRRSSGESTAALTTSSSFSFQRAVHGAHSALSFHSALSGGGSREELPVTMLESSGLTEYEAVGSIVLMCFGVGLAVLPKAVSEAGYIITPVLMIICAVVILEQSIQISKACEVAEALTGEPITCYEDLANVCGGSRWLNALRISKAGGALSAVSSFAEFASSNTFVLLSCLTGDLGNSNKTNVNYIRFFVIAPIMMGLGMLKDLKHFASIMNVGVVAATMNGGAIVLGGVWRLFLLPACHSLGDKKYEEGSCIFRAALPTNKKESPVFLIGMAASLCVFGILVPGFYPNTRHQLAEPKKIQKVALTSFWLTLGIFGVVMIGGYVGTGQNVKDNALDNYVENDVLWVRYVGLFAQVVDTLVASPIYLLGVVNAFESTGTDPLRTPLALPNVILRAGIVALVITVSALCPYPEIIMIVSSFFGIFVHLVWPVYLTALLKGKWIAAGRAPAQIEVSASRTGARIVIMVFGLLVCFFSMYGAVNKLMAQIYGHH